MVPVVRGVTLKLDNLRRFRSAIEDGAGHPAIRAALKQWGARYRGFAQRRFDKFSKGGGDWPPLAASTLAGRRKGSNKKAKIKAAILRDTGTLFAALNPSFGAPGAIEQTTKFGIVVGYGGPGRYPQGGATIADIANFHQTGAGHLPVRRIIVPPPSDVIAGMISDMERALQKMANGTRD